MDAQHSGRKEQIQLVTIEEAGRMLAMSRASVYKLMEDGELKWVKLGRSRRIPLKAIESLIERSTVGA